MHSRAILLFSVKWKAFSTKYNQSQENAVVFGNTTQITNIYFKLLSIQFIYSALRCNDFAFFPLFFLLFNIYLETLSNSSTIFRALHFFIPNIWNVGRVFNPYAATDAVAFSMRHFNRKSVGVFLCLLFAPRSHFKANLRQQSWNIYLRYLCVAVILLQEIIKKTVGLKLWTSFAAKARAFWKRRNWQWDEGARHQSKIRIFLVDCGK